LRTSPPPPTSTIVPGRVRTTPNAHPVSPSANPSPTSHQRRRKLRAIVSRSLSRCSSPEASSFQPRIREASDRWSAAPGWAVTASLEAGGPETFTDDSKNTLAITSVELVLRKVELKPVERSNCESGSGPEPSQPTAANPASDGNQANEMNDAAEECEELEAGP